MFYFIIFYLLVHLSGFMLSIIISGRKEEEKTVSFNLIENLSLGFFMGFGFFSLIIFYFNILLKIPISPQNILLSSIFVFFLVICFFQKKYKNTIEFVFIKKESKKFDFFEKIISCFIVFFISFSFFNNVFFPITDWDAFALYDSRAKMFTHAQNILPAIENMGNYFFGYPLYTSFLHFFSYSFGVNNPKFFYSLMYLFFLLLSYEKVKENSNRKIALTFTLVNALIGDFFKHSMIAYTNFPYSVYLLLSLIYFNEYFKHKRERDFHIGLILTLLTNWVRFMEPFWLVIVIVFFFKILKNKEKIELKKIIKLSLVLIPFLSWLIFSFKYKVNSVNGQQDSGGLLEIIGRIKNTSPMISGNKFYELIIYLYEYLLKPYLNWFFFYLVLLIKKTFSKKENKINYLDLIFFSFNLVIFLGVALFSFYIPYWKEIGGSLVRMIFFLPNFIVYYFFDTFTNKKTTLSMFMRKGMFKFKLF